MYKEAQDRVVAGEVRDTRSDPLRCLPVELAELILQYVPFRDLMYVFFLSLPLPCLTYWKFANPTLPSMYR